MISASDTYIDREYKRRMLIILLIGVVTAIDWLSLHHQPERGCENLRADGERQARLRFCQRTDEMLIEAVVTAAIQTKSACEVRVYTLWSIITRRVFIFFVSSIKIPSLISHSNRALCTIDDGIVRVLNMRLSSNVIYEREHKNEHTYMHYHRRQLRLMLRGDAHWVI